MSKLDGKHQKFGGESKKNLIGFTNSFESTFSKSGMRPNKNIGKCVVLYGQCHTVWSFTTMALQRRLLQTAGLQYVDSVNSSVPVLKHEVYPMFRTQNCSQLVL